MPGIPNERRWGEVWATRPGQWRTSGGFCPFPPPPPASAPAARVCPPRSLCVEIRFQAGSPRAPAAATSSSSYREQCRGGTGRRGASPAPLAQPSPARLPPHAGAGAAAAAAAGREGGGRNPARSTRAPSWTIMIPSKPTTTCSRKRTGIGTCSWTRHGRSSRERSAASPARRSPPAGAAPPAALPAPGSERAPGSHERGRGMRGRCEVGCWVTGAGGRGRAPFPEPANAEPERGEVGPLAGRSPWGPRFRPPGLSRTVPAWAGGGRRCLEGSG